MADTDGSDLDQVTDMMLDALRVLAVSSAAVIRRHADLKAGEIPVRTASALERRGWAARRHPDPKTTILEITADGLLAAAGYGYDVAVPSDAVPLSPQQIAHIERAIRYLGEAMTALSWAQIPMPSHDGREAGDPAIGLLVKGERLVAAASDALIAGMTGHPAAPADDV